jgi:hypothetical protein
MEARVLYDQWADDQLRFQHLTLARPEASCSRHGFPGVDLALSSPTS